MDINLFFDMVRASPALGSPRLTQTQVDVGVALLDKGKHLSAPALAYVLATAWGEAKWTPQRENLNYTTTARLKAVWPSRFKTDASAKPYLNNPVKLANFVYGGRMGNRPGTNDGYDYRGGGLDQLTARDNYAKRGLQDNPELILKAPNAVKSILMGMQTGDYRGPKLADYFTPSKTDFVGARNIINADAKLNGETYARYARAFLAALEAAGYGKPPTVAPLPPATSTASPVLFPAIVLGIGALIAAYLLK